MRRIMISSSLLILLLTGPVLAQTAAEKQASVAYVQSLQQKSGGFVASKATDQPTLRATSSGLRALKYFGGKVPDPRGAIGFVESCFDKSSGGFADTPGGKPDMFTTSVGLMAATELKMPLEPYRQPAVAFLVKNAKNFEDMRIAAAALDTIGEKISQADGLGQRDHQGPEPGRHVWQWRGPARPPAARPWQCCGWAARSTAIPSRP